MKLSAFVFRSELQYEKLAYIWFNAREARVTTLATEIVQVEQAQYQQATEKKLLELVKEEYPNASIFEDDRGYRYIKTR